MIAPPTDDPNAEQGTLSIVGIGPGSPDHLTDAARSAITGADVVYAAELYQRFLRSDGLLSADEKTAAPTVIESERGRQAELAIESFERVRSGQDVVHVSGGDPNVYGKSDLLLSVAANDGYTDIDIEVIPGVTAALGGAASLGSPLSNDVATISLSDAWRDWDEIERKLRGATEVGFVLALYNGWRALGRAIDVVRERRSDDTLVAVLEDVTRGELGRNPAGETVTIATLGSVMADAPDEPTPGLLAIVGTEETRVVRTDHGQLLLTPRGDIELEAFDP